MPRYDLTDAEVSSCIVNRMWVDPRNGNVRFIDDMTQDELFVAHSLMEQYDGDSRVTDLSLIIQDAIKVWPSA